MRVLSLTALVALVASSNAFMTAPAMRSATRLSLMTTEEAEKVLKHANDCHDGECSVDEVSDLIDVLKTAERELRSRVDEVQKTIKSLEQINENDDREVDQVRETVRALYRVFQLGDKASGNDYPSLSKPTGYSGEVGDGPTTAFDALPPKKWKA